MGRRARLAGDRETGVTSKLNSGSVPLLAVPLLGSTSARIQFTPLGSGSAWKVDDVYVDPWLSR